MLVISFGGIIAGSFETRKFERQMNNSITKGDITHSLRIRSVESIMSSEEIYSRSEPVCSPSPAIGYTQCTSQKKHSSSPIRCCHVPRTDQFRGRSR